MFDYSYRYTDEVIAENATNPLRGEDNTIGNETEKASNKNERQGKIIKTKKTIKKGKKIGIQ